MVKVNGIWEFNNDETYDIINKYVKYNLSINKISKEYGCGESVIKKLLQNNEVYIRKSTSRYRFNKNIFDVIDSEEKAYWLGFIWCDGYNAKRCRNGTTNNYEFKLELAKIDINHLVKFKHFLNSNHDIKTYKYKTSFCKNDEFTETARILLSNTEFGRMLDNKFGLIANRFDASKVIKSIPNRLYRHFIRGILDADGSIVLSSVSESNGRKYKKVTVNFSTYGQLVEFINNTLASDGVANCKSKEYKRHEDRDGECVCLKFCGNINAVRILDWIYKDSSIYLDRKYQKYIEIKML